MQETRIIKLNSKERYAYDQKWETRLDIQNMQGLIDFYGVLGFEIDQMERTKLVERILPKYTKEEEIFNMVSHIVGGVLRSSR